MRPVAREPLRRGRARSGSGEESAPRATLFVVRFVLEMAEKDAAFADEIRTLTPAQLEMLEAELTLRDEARALALELGRDVGDIYHQLKQLRREPRERLRIGLALGRRRPQRTE